MVASKTLLRWYEHLRSSGGPRRGIGDEPPLRSELLSADQMEQYGRTLAGLHNLKLEPTPDQLLKRLDENESALTTAWRVLTAALKGSRRITPAGEWLLDNFYLIEEQIRTARRHLPTGYSRELPRLAGGPSAGLPRVYDIALSIISHGDGRLDPESMRRFVAAYQTVSELKIGEIWAIPIMLRLALIENLRRVALRIASHMTERALASMWADKLMETAAADPKNLILVIAEMARSNPPMNSSFVAELARRLQGQSASLALGITWIEQQLFESNLSIEQLVQAETQLQAADQVSISNSIGSLRFLGAMDWATFVEDQSIVEHTLRMDPVGVYSNMEFATRDQYRHVVEKLAKHSPLSETQVARKAIELAAANLEAPQRQRTAHVGYYLISDGLPDLAKAASASASVSDGLRAWLRRRATLVYLGSIIAVTCALSLLPIEVAFASRLPQWVQLIVACAAVVAASQLAASLVNWLSTLFMPPEALPRLDFANGVSPEAHSLVVIPTLITSEENIANLVEAIEVRFLANRDDYIQFALLTDFADAATETLPNDELLLESAEAKVEELNEKYKTNDADIFYLLHRPRVWNPQEKVWMGRERKRGKLEELNAILRGGDRGRFSKIVGNVDALQSVKYVITLDTDTHLPRDAARQFVGAIAHPLNTAFFDENKGRVTQGYGILQPRVGVSLPSTNQSMYAELHGNEPGIDPYTRTVSDVYQDLFCEGSFIGKGIYNVDAFELTLKDRFPDNRILSHDLLEGCYVRSGLLSDVELYEDYPTGYAADVSRRHRWIRGDWQLVNWLFPFVPVKGARNERNPLSLISRWKLFDNLRRSLVPFALVLLFVLGWTMLENPWFWTAIALGVLFVPPLIFSVLELFRKPSDVLLPQHLTATTNATVRRFTQTVFGFVCLPYEALFSLDAICRTIVRKAITHSRLLEWRPSGDASARDRTDLSGYYYRMFGSVLIATATFGFLLFLRPESLLLAFPALLMWTAAPAIAWWIGLPQAEPITGKLTASQHTFLRKVARRTWLFFDEFVRPEDNWLAPDNYQEANNVGVAHRTSPTNMGLSLLANLAAYDFGYIHPGDVIDRTGKILGTMATLERHRGHLYNWYDTQTLKPLPPRYISTVDSGNLAGHLFTLNPGLNELKDLPILESRIFLGMEDTLSILKDCLGQSTLTELQQFEIALRSAVLAPTTLTSLRSNLMQLSKCGSDLSDRVEVTASTECKVWARALGAQAASALAELQYLAPWSQLPSRTDSDGISDVVPTLRELSQIVAPATESSARQELIAEGRRRAKERLENIEELIALSSDLANMEYEFLYDKGRRLLAIGYNAEDRRRDPSFYDLLASEARLCNFVAVAQGQLPQESWFALARSLTTVDGEQVLFSWSGSMFEYLMPLLVMPTYSNTLLDQTYRNSVRRQIEYGNQRGIPWGISESGYAAVDVHLNYQYHAFGVPGLGLKRGLAQDLVIAPYATAMALMVEPEEACANLERLAEYGCLAKYGFYEAVDYTASRVPHGQSHVVVKSFMAHHQGMSLLSLDYLLLDKPMQRRFEEEPSFRATTLLLQERVPKASVFHSQGSETSDPRMTVTEDAVPLRYFKSPTTVLPEVQLLSNGRYHVMMTNAGGGYSRWKDIAVTRWREDSTCDSWGTFCYIRDIATGEFWSTSYQPTLKPSETYEAIFTEPRVEFRRRDHDFDTHSEIVVSSEDDIELRRLRITNRSYSRRTVEITTYAEVVLADQMHDAAHPAFSNLFLQTEIIEQKQAILCNRRPRSETESHPWMFHLVAVHGADTKAISYETDRSKFIGRGNTLKNPSAMQGRGPLSGSQGSVLDPIVAIRCVVTLDPESSATINMVTGIAEDREGCLALVEKYQDRPLADRVFDLAWTHSQVVLRQLNATESDGQLYARLANSIIYANSSLRADPSVLVKNTRGQSGLWGYAISGDLPIVLLQIKELENMELVRQMVQAHAYWRMKGLVVDLVIWNEDRAGYRQAIQEQIMGLIAGGAEANLIDRPGGIFVRAAEQISAEDRILLQTVARAIISDSRGSLSDQITKRQVREPKIPRFTPTRSHRAENAPIAESQRADLVLTNGIGGFTPDGREYVITTSPGRVTPAPWVNVLANPHFGSIISENGLAYTWLENAHEFRLTPWRNDPVTDAAGEAFYIRDEDTGYFWSPTPLPARGATPYSSRHGFGYSVFEHTEDGITSELRIFVAPDAPIKLATLKVRNHSGRARRLSASGYVEWVLGDLREKTNMHVTTEVDAITGAIFARNSYNTDFPTRIAFFDVDDAKRSVTGDRTEFLGRNGTMAQPVAMLRTRLSGKVGAGLDPCAAIQVPFDLAEGEEREIVFRLGIGVDVADATTLINRFRGKERDESFERMCEYWKHTLGAVHVQTPDPSLNMLVNGWLLYQTIASRMWGRSGYYQSGGAFGFRDQLQDAMALVHAEPLLLRKQLLLHASRQFVEGDVQHWWHPPSGRGVRTRCSDDYLWLPLATCRYVVCTGDTGVLHERAQYLIGRPVNPQDDSYYDLFAVSQESGTLYEHCKKAIELRLNNLGVHGLPLMEGGDWNDGMNLVGAEGKGESVWLGFFVHEVLRSFVEVATIYDDHTFARYCEAEAKKLRENIEANAWDGNWYRRAYFDDGTPLGSHTNDECQIDSISQSWSVLSGAGDAKRVRQAMASVNQHLVRREDGLIQLLEPPFDKSALNPGYIKGYVPGVRENGGQYTHAAVWATMAFAALGDNNRAWEAFGLINPVNHSLTPEKMAIYKVEPYVVAADVYGVPPHSGRGGWSWYTGSAAWMYRLIVESLLGLKLRADKLYFDPCFPSEWKTFKVHYRYRETVYHITVTQSPDPVDGTGVIVDGACSLERWIYMVDDRREHFVDMMIPIKP